ncbi:hypothetical protein WJX72_004121 [[Myrmecia] bisecta]|uniref:NB-ARC domain-containing protein n=1 Tax=[Myrmecia] bisecta TaxID=41462 RepID=A0AAW1Q0X7_9CHLO
MATAGPSKAQPASVAIAACILAASQAVNLANSLAKIGQNLVTSHRNLQALPAELEAFHALVKAALEVLLKDLGTPQAEVKDLLGKDDAVGLLETMLARHPRVLLVLDGVWDNSILEDFPVQSRLSRRLVTSRKNLELRRAHKLQLTDEINAGVAEAVLAKEAACPTEIPQTTCKQALTAILVKCGGCLLAVAILGRVLRNQPPSNAAWQRVCDQLSTYAGLPDWTSQDYTRHTIYSSLAVNMDDLCKGREGAAASSLLDVLQVMALFPSAVAVPSVLVELVWQAIQPDSKGFAAYTEALVARNLAMATSPPGSPQAAGIAPPITWSLRRGINAAAGGSQAAGIAAVSTDPKGHGPVAAAILALYGELGASRHAKEALWRPQSRAFVSADVCSSGTGDVSPAMPSARTSCPLRQTRLPFMKTELERSSSSSSSEPAGSPAVPHPDDATLSLESAATVIHLSLIDRSEIDRMVHAKDAAGLWKYLHINPNAAADAIVAACLRRRAL